MKLQSGKMKLQSGNSKLSKTIGAWSLPAAHEVCGRVCPGCYSYKAQKRFPSVGVARYSNYEASKAEDFDVHISKSMKFVRVHADGEFYSQEYVNKWVRIAKRNPDTIFYAYTKRQKDFDFTEMKALSNFALHNSICSDGSVNFGKAIGDKQQGFVCPDTLGEDVRCGETCLWCFQKCNENTQILFEAH